MPLCKLFFMQKEPDEIPTYHRNQDIFLKRAVGILIMKNIKKQALVVIGGLAMIMNAGAASSSTTYASATIDWSTFAITGYGLGLNAAPSYTLSGQSTNTSSSTNDWVNWSSDIANNASSIAAGTAGTGAGTGSASASRSANINISGTGFLVISADYAINAAIKENSCFDYYCYDYNSANASASFNLSNYSSITSGSSSSQANTSLGSPWWYGNPIITSDQKQGNLSVGVLVNNGDVLNFSSAVSAAAHEVFPVIPLPIITGGGYVSGSYTSSGSVTTVVNFPVYSAPFTTAVPVPAAMWLFSSALVGLIGLGRHRRAVMA